MQLPIHGQENIPSLTLLSRWTRRSSGLMSNTVQGNQYSHRHSKPVAMNLQWQLLQNIFVWSPRPFRGALKLFQRPISHATMCGKPFGIACSRTLRIRNGDSWCERRECMKRLKILWKRGLMSTPKQTNIPNESIHWETWQSSEDWNSTKNLQNYDSHRFRKSVTKRGLWDWATERTVFVLLGSLRCICILHCIPIMNNNRQALLNLSLWTSYVSLSNSD